LLKSSERGNGQVFAKFTDSLLEVWNPNLTTTPPFGPIAVLLSDIPDVDEEKLTWRDLPGFPKLGFQRAQIYLREGGVPFAKLNLHLDDDGYPDQPLDEVLSVARPNQITHAPVNKARTEYPLVTVVLSTAGMRPDLLRRCIKSLIAMSYPAYEIVVVDNRSQSLFDEGAEIWSETSTGNDDAAGNVTVVREPRAGLSYARNTGVAVAHGEIIAFTDDDVAVDADWLSGIVDAFDSSTDVKCVTGLVIPEELETEAQQLFEIFSSGLDRGLLRHSWANPTRQSSHHNPLKRSNYLVVDSESPNAPAQSFYTAIGNCGVGANMAVRRDFARQYPFDDALGVGSMSMSAEDIQLFANALWAGFCVVYTPVAIVRHTHRRTVEDLEIQMRSIGVGYTALLTSLIFDDPSHVVGLALCGGPAALIRWIRSAFSGQSAAEGREERASYPASLRRNELIGMMLGPQRYLRSRRRVRVMRRTN
jgi:GT2 family glycosyltransferase